MGKRLKRILICLLCLYSWSANGQHWNKKQAAVVLTYDDALHVHLNHAVPALDKLDLKGTFFLTAASPAFTTRLGEWEKVAAQGHELANHTLFHPCDGSLPGRGFVTADYDLAGYSIRRMKDEISMTNTVLEAIDGMKERTFAYPCGDTKVGGVSYVDHLKELFVAARGVHSEMVADKAVDLYNVGSFVVSGQTGEELIALVRKAMETGSLVVFLFHGVGGEHQLDVSLEAHNQLLRFIKENEAKVWNPTFREAASWIRERKPAN